MNKVEKLIQDWQLTHPEGCSLAMTILNKVRQHFPQLSEEVKYGGILISAATEFCGIFVYQAHISIEFGQGVLLQDPKLLLEGKGKYRRHLKIKTQQDIESKEVLLFIKQALVLSQS